MTDIYTVYIPVGRADSLIYSSPFAVGSSVDQVLFGYDLDQSKKSSSSSDSDGASHQDVEHQKAFDPKPDWEWLPKMRLHDLGYLAALVQMFAATIFWVSTMYVDVALIFDPLRLHC